ncbi:MAG: hypothetical protein ACRENP_23405 [Longimicrobiales bacterium]
MPATLNVKAGWRRRLSDALTIKVTDTTQFAGNDVLEGLPHTPGWPPAVALIPGRDTTYAFVRSVEIGQLTSDTIAVFTANFQSVMPLLSNSGDERIALNTISAPLEIPVTIWIPDATVNGDWTRRITEDVVKQHANQANEVLRLNRVGLRLKDTVQYYNENTPTACADFRPGSAGLNVYFVEAIPGLGLSRGVWCRSTDGGAAAEAGAAPVPREDILIRYNAPRPTLLHEIGHALSLEVHTDGADGFERRDNIMKHTEKVRRHISLGQAFRMNYDSDSWIFKAAANLPQLTRPRMQCDALARWNGCPELKKDIRKKDDR